MTNYYGPYDAELLKQDKQNQLKAIYTAAKFEGVNLKVNGGRGSGRVGAFIQRLVAGLAHKAQFVAYIWGRSARHA